jgi:hypothetical protein
MSKITGWKALDEHVLVVATSGFGEWTAYIGAVPGHSHDAEVSEVAANGSKLSQKLATILFPTLAAENRWRD